MKVVVLTGGVGGAKFALGLQNCDEVSELTAIVNTGDDFEHLGLFVSPDIDTLLYTLSGKSNQVLGWGRADETWNFMAALKSIGGPEWFNLGDGDIALHVLRSNLMAQGEGLSQITSKFVTQWGIKAKILPMSDERVSTWVDTQNGELPFQHYFVKFQCAPIVKSIRFEGAKSAKAGENVLTAINEADAIFIAPSNPYLSIDPILALDEISQALRVAKAPKIAISPIVGGTSVKGPTAKLMGELGLEINNEVIAAHYSYVIDGLLHDVSDIAPNSIAAFATSTLMKTLDDKIRVAKAALAFAKALST